MDGPGAVLLDVAHMELFGGELAIQVEDGVLPGDSLGHLGGEESCIWLLSSMKPSFLTYSKTAA